MKFTPIALAGLLVAGCGAIPPMNPKYADIGRGMSEGFPELAVMLGERSDTNCMLGPEVWEPVFVAETITSPRRVSNALNGMFRNGQILFAEETRSIFVMKPYCDPATR